MIQLKDWPKLVWGIALYFVAEILAVLLNLTVDRHGNMFYAPAFTALIFGVVYFTLLKVVPRFGLQFLIGAAMSLFFLRTGHASLSFLPGLIFPLVADIIGKLGNYRSRIGNALAYLFFSLGNTGPLLFMWLKPDEYKADLLKRGKDMAYVNKVMLPAEPQHIIWFFVATVLGVVLGIVLAKKVEGKNLLPFLTKNS